jgi:uncharacterized protein YndB with AHSA1/START domain
MSVKKDASGRRWVEVEVEVPGTPEQVWQAIATGPGVSAWFVPTEVREDGKIVSHFGPGMDSVATRTAWDPPHRFAAESAGFGPNPRPLATEWSVEARAGGTCIVRVVHSLFASTDDWDDQLESVESGWPAFFRILWLYLAHFAGKAGASMQFVSMTPQSPDKAWEMLTGPLGLAGAQIGERRQTSAGAPPLAGLVESPAAGSAHSHRLLLRLDAPAPGLIYLCAVPQGAKAMIMILAYFYGDDAAAVVAREEPVWQAWMKECFAAVAEPSPAS